MMMMIPTRSLHASVHPSTCHGLRRPCFFFFLVVARSDLFHPGPIPLSHHHTHDDEHKYTQAKGQHSVAERSVWLQPYLFLIFTAGS